MQQYRFSPNTSTEQLHEAVVYICNSANSLFSTITNEKVSITSVSVFAHYPNEFEFLKNTVVEMGTFVGDTNGPRVALTQPIVVGENTITHLRIRQSDPYHGQVGCVDFDVPSYAVFKENFLGTHPNNLRLLVRPEYELIECFDPNVDVLGYVLSEPERSKR